MLNNMHYVYDKEKQLYFAPKPMKPKGWEAYEGSHTSVGIIDSGILLEHPIIKKSNIVKMRDFTGEGINDRNGHGTAVALIFLSIAPKTKLYIAKALDEDKMGCEDWLIDAIKWLIEEKVYSILIACGIEKLSPCDSNCKVCQVINEITSLSPYITIYAASGNDPNKYYCPACNPHVLAIGAINKERGLIGHQYTDFYQFDGIPFYPVDAI